MNSSSHDESTPINENAWNRTEVYTALSVEESSSDEEESKVALVESNYQDEEKKDITIQKNEYGGEESIRSRGNESESESVDNHNNDDFNDYDANDDTFRFYEEAGKLFNIALPTVATQFCTFFVYPQTASIIGLHLPSEYLGAFSLGSLAGNLTCTSIIIGTLSSSETLQPRAFGLKQYREVGLIAIRGCVFCILALIPPIWILLSKGDALFVALLGQQHEIDSGEGEVEVDGEEGGSSSSNEEAGHAASAWIRVYLWSVPAVLLFRSTQRYLACQNIVTPCLYAAMVACFFVHPIILRYAVYRYGFLGSAGAVSVTQFVAILLAFYFIRIMKVHEVQTWPCWPTSYNSWLTATTTTTTSIHANTKLNTDPSKMISPSWSSLWSFVREALQWEGFSEYARLSFGGILALSEWWFWESICVVAGKFGLSSLCVHTIAYQVIPITFMIPLGTGIGLSVRMGKILPVSVHSAKRLAIYTMVFTTAVGILVSIILYQFRSKIISTFTADEVVMKGCDTIWWDLCVYNVVMYIFGINSAILRALGLQWRMAATIICCLWLGSMPAIVYFCFMKDGGLLEMWKILPWSYIVLNVGLVISYATVSWQDIGKLIREKSREG